MSGSEVYAAGRKAPASGLYRTGTGRQVALSKGERFPPSFSGWELVQAARGTATDLGLRSPTALPTPDHAEQLVVVRRAIYDARTQAGHWRQVTGVANAAAIASQRDRDADVLEHVLRRLIAEGGDVQ